MTIYPIVENENEAQITDYKQSYKQVCFDTKENISDMIRSQQFFLGSSGLCGGAIAMTTIGLVAQGPHVLMLPLAGVMGISSALFMPCLAYIGYQGIKLLPKYVEYKKLSKKHKLQNVKKQEEKVL